MSNSVDTSELLRFIGELSVVRRALVAENEALKFRLRRLEAQVAENEPPLPQEEETPL